MIGAVIAFNSHILFFPDMGRVGVAFAFMAGMVWALLEDRPLWSVIFAILIVFSHYSNSLISLGLVGMVWMFYYGIKRKILKTYLLAFVTLLLLTGVWHFGISRYSGFVMVEHLTQHTLTDVTGDLTPMVYQLEQIDWLDIESREQSVQMALGVGIDSVPRLAEVVMNWIIVGLIGLGFLKMLLNKAVDLQYKLISGGMMFLIMFTIAVPYLSVQYNAMRVYFSALCVLSLCLPVAVSWLSDKKKIAIPVMIAIVLLYGSLTSGIAYRAFGLEKTFPVYYQIEWRNK